MAIDDCDGRRCVYPPRATRAVTDIGLSRLVYRSEKTDGTLSEFGCVRTALADGSDNRPQRSADQQTRKIMREAKPMAGLLKPFDEKGLRFRRAPESPLTSG